MSDGEHSDGSTLLHRPVNFNWQSWSGDRTSDDNRVTQQDNEQQGQAMNTQENKQNINNEASNEGAQGTFNAPVYINQEAQQPNLSPPFMAPDPPIDYVMRPEIDQVIEHLYDTQPSKRVAITGAGGFGKTTFAQIICHDERTQKIFKDGILWVSLGDGPQNLTEHICDLIEMLSGSRPSLAQPGPAAIKLSGILRDKTVLLVIDDVRNSSHLEHFLQGASHCPRLITTRNLTTLPVNTLIIDLMRPSEDLDLLQRNPDMRRAVEDGLVSTMTDFSDEQRDLFTFVGVLGKGSWRLDMLAAVVVRRPFDIRHDLDVLIKRCLVQRYGERYQMNAVVSKFAQRLLQQKSSRFQNTAYILLVYECLNHARRLAQSLTEHPYIRTSSERGSPQYNEYFVCEYQNLISPEVPHIQEVIQWTHQKEQWHLLLQFSDVAYGELLSYFVANAFDNIKMSLSLATLVEPIVWTQGFPQVPAFQSLVSMNYWQCIPPPEDIAQQKRDEKHFKSELGLNLQAGHIIDGLFEGISLLDAHWMAVRATGLICSNMELIGCDLIACDFSRSVWTNCNARQLTITGSILNHALLKTVDLHRASLRDADLTGAVLEKVKLRGADLGNCDLTDALLDDVDLRGADLRGARVDSAIFRNVRFQGCRSDGVDWTTAFIVGDLSSTERDEIMTALGPQALDRVRSEMPAHPRVDAHNKLESISTSTKKTSIPLRDLDFTGFDLRAITDDDLRISDCQFGKTDFRAARLKQTDFSRADLQGADFRGANLDMPTFRRANLRGADLRTARLIDANLEEADLTGAELRCAVMQQGQLKKARLRGARLRNASLVHAQLQEAELIEVDLSSADLEGAQLQGAKLVKASLRGAHLTGADLSGVDLSEADCDETNFTGATLADADLARAASWRDAILPSGQRVLMIKGDNVQDLTILEQARDQLRLAYLDGELQNLDLDEQDLLGAQLVGNFVSVSFSQATLDYGRLPGTFSVAYFKHAALRNTDLSGIFTATQFDEAVLTGARLRGVFVRCSFKAIDLQGTIIEGASLVSCDFSESQDSEGLLWQVFRLRGCILPDGTRYDGRFNLPGDRQEAVKYGYDLAKPDQRADFYNADKLTVRHI